MATERPNSSMPKASTVGMVLRDGDGREERCMRLPALPATPPQKATCAKALSVTGSPPAMSTLFEYFSPIS